MQQVSGIERHWHFRKARAIGILDCLGRCSAPVFHARRPHETYAVSPGCERGLTEILSHPCSLTLIIDIALCRHAGVKSKKRSSCHTQLHAACRHEYIARTEHGSCAYVPPRPLLTALASHCSSQGVQLGTGSGHLPGFSNGGSRQLLGRRARGQPSVRQWQRSGQGAACCGPRQPGEPLMTKMWLKPHGEINHIFHEGTPCRTKAGVFRC